MKNWLVKPRNLLTLDHQIPFAEPAQATPWTLRILVGVRSGPIEEALVDATSLKFFACSRSALLQPY